jgi:hypothetical protein
MNEKIKFALDRFQRLKRERNKFSEAFDACDLASRQTFAERYGIVNEICFAETHAHDAPADERLAQSANDSFDFGKFGHVM